MQCDHVVQTAKLQAMAQVPGKFTYAIITFCVYTDHGGMIALAHWSYYTGLDQKTSENLEDYVKWKVNMIENILESSLHNYVKTKGIWKYKRWTFYYSKTTRKANVVVTIAAYV